VTSESVGNSEDTQFAESTTTTVDPTTVDPTTVDPTTDTETIDPTGSETTDDETSPGSETDDETDTEGLPACIEPPEPDFAIQVLDPFNQDPIVFPCGPQQEVTFVSTWYEGHLLVKPCPSCIDCFGPPMYEIEVSVPPGDPELAFDATKIPSEQCLEIEIDAALETPDPNGCLASGLVLRDPLLTPRYVAVDRQLHIPAGLADKVDLELDTEPCMSCDGNDCCDTPEPGTSILIFESDYLQEPLWLDPGDDAPVTFFDKLGKAKNYRSTVMPLCEAPAYTWVISTLPLE